MTGLRDLLDEVANDGPPPGGIGADEVYAAGRRRHRRRTTAAVGGLATLSVAVLTLALGAFPGRPDTAPPPADRASPSPQPPAAPVDRLQGFGAADADHLYAWHLACGSTPCEKRGVQLVGSADGGRSWTDRGRPVPTAEIAVLGPDTLLSRRSAGADGSGLTVSTDGGRTWTAAPPAGRPVASVPAGHALLCLPTDGGSGCELRVVDPASGRVAPLAAPPPLTTTTGAEGLRVVAPGDRGALHVAGADRGTGRPAVASSADRGRTWSVRTFPVAATCTPQTCGWWTATAADGTGYLVLPDGTGRALVYRSTADGSWQRRDTGAVPAGDRIGEDPGFVTADGTHVWCRGVPVPGVDLDGCQFWAAGSDDDRYRPVGVDGPPAAAAPVRRTADGWYHTLDLADGLPYGSADGRRWTPVRLP